MAEILIVGLPSALRARFFGRANGLGLRVTTILADIGKEGTPRLLPDPRHAIHTVREYSERVEPANVIALMYAPIPDEVLCELRAISDLEMGAIDIIENGRAGWPEWNRRQGFDQQFLDALFHALEIELWGAPEVAIPSEHIRALALRNNRFLVAEGSLDRCSEISSRRHKFVCDAAGALEELCAANGGVGRLEDYFRQRSLNFAHSGGSKVRVEVYQDGKRIYVGETFDHLKQGDATTPQAAARVYFHTLMLFDTYYVVVLYAGPHPKSDFARRIEMQ